MSASIAGMDLARPGTERSATAVFSDDRRYRYVLTRRWDFARPHLVVIGLNPSTADETQDDPTIRRCAGYAKAWGYGGLVMLNLFAFRSTDPRGLRTVADPIGPGNDGVLCALTDGRRTLCAWGSHGYHLKRAATVLELLAGRELLCLGVTGNGQPKHPLYLRADLEPVPFPVGGAR